MRLIFKIKNFYQVVLFVMLIIISGCSSTLMFTNLYNDKINIDGNQNDWGKSLNFDAENNIGVGFTNDDKNLYVAVVASQRTNIMKILNMGLTIWLESDNSGERIGIRFPQKADDLRMPIRTRPGQDENPSMDEMKQQVMELIKSQNEISVVNKNNFPLYAYNKNSKESLSAGLDFTMGQLVYELKVPLAANKESQFVFNAMPGENILVEIESGESERPDMGSRGMSAQADGADGTGMPGGRGRKGGKMGSGSPRGNMKDMFKKIEYKAEVKLAN